MTEMPAELDRRIQLDVTGMTCQMCAGRIAKRLNKVDGVRASVNFGTKTATIYAREDIVIADLCGVIRRAGYDATERVAAVVDKVPADDGIARNPFQQLLTLVAALLSWLGIRRR